MGHQDARAPRVLYVQYTHPGHYPPLVHGAEMLRRAGCRLLFAGIGEASDPQAMPAGPDVVVRLLRPAHTGWSRPFHYAAFALWVAWLAVRYRPDWVYASDPLACVPAWCLTRAVRARVVYHEHDAPAATGAAGRSPFWSLVLAARRAVARSADLRVAPSTERARLLEASSSGRPVEVVWNCPLVRQVAEERDATGGLRLVYHGTIVPHRVPLSLIDALRATPDDVSLTIIGYETVGHEGYVAAIAAAALAAGVGHRVHCRPALARDDLMAGCAAFDVGLSLLPSSTEEVNERSMVGASNKPFDYMACGLALIVPARDEWRDAFVTPGYALACRAEDAADLARAFTWLRDHAERRRDMGRGARRRILEDWNYDRLFAPVVERMVSAVPAPLRVTERGRA